MDGKLTGAKAGKAARELSQDDQSRKPPGTSLGPERRPAHSLTESLMILRKVRLKRMQNCVRQLAEKLWQPSMEAESCGRTRGGGP